MAWSQVKTEATMWYIIRSRTAQKFRIVNWVWDPTDHVTFLPSSHPPTFLHIEAKLEKRPTKFIRFPWLDMIAIVTDRLPGQPKVFFVFLFPFLWLFWLTSKLARNRLAKQSAIKIEKSKKSWIAKSLKSLKDLCETAMNLSSRRVVST